jgi:polyribonucleotide nucleotidyltransferase
MLGAVTFGHDGLPAGDQHDHRAWPKQCAKEPFDVPAPSPAIEAVKAKFAKDGTIAALAEAYKNVVKQDRYAKVGEVKKAAIASLGDDAEALAVRRRRAEGPRVRRRARRHILKTGIRIDGRDTKTVRPSKSKSASCRALMVPRCSPVARPRRWWS